MDCVSRQGKEDIPLHRNDDGVDFRKEARGQRGFSQKTGSWRGGSPKIGSWSCMTCIAFVQFNEWIITNNENNDESII